MITIYRKIRKSLSGQNRFTRYLLYAVDKILVVHFDRINCRKSFPNPKLWGLGFLWSDSSRKFDLRKLAPLGEGGCVEIIKLL